MTASLFVTGTGVGWIGRDLRPEDRGADPLVGVVHAVARPVVDGLDSSVCGVLVTATATSDWASDGVLSRCEECARIAG
ncbi:hypothetical protein [Blastococcus capsensis]|uniref:hypothetical protein n=1 Tax=Blastococcus capsensis TaxID=1564163 RepID=UPI002540969B|nr:hypothetical protein [Blastococcus capsensis]MDK3257449.1 hypothetical protein [Blastococcus capsensis]